MVNQPEIDSLQQYSRKGYAIKIGVGSKETFLDFIFLNVSDDTLFLENYNPENSIKPSANAVVGINTNVKFSKKLLFKLNGAYSVYTSDIYSMDIGNDMKFLPSVLPTINLSTENYFAIKGACCIDFKTTYPGLLMGSGNLHPVSEQVSDDNKISDFQNVS